MDEGGADEGGFALEAEVGDVAVFWFELFAFLSVVEHGDAF